MPLSEMFNPSEIKVSITGGAVFHQTRVDFLRLDEIHPVVSGNKLFKLIPYLKEAMHSDHKTLITFGGAFSNHLHATAFACRAMGIKSIGLVRGAELTAADGNLYDCQDMGMELHFLTRESYKKLSEDPAQPDMPDRYGPAVIVPAGGYGITGAKGASAIYSTIPAETYTHICLPAGTGTTLAGLLLEERKEKIVAFPALKGMQDIPERMQVLGVKSMERLSIITEYHFGGFARYTPELLTFMKDIYEKFRIPLDFVYTAKMVYGISRLAAQGYFPEEARVLAIHTGGLQGNRSLPGGGPLA